MTAPSVLLVPRELGFVASDLEDVYNLLRLWDDPPADELAHARVLVCLGHQSPEALIARMPRLELIACYTTGYDAVNVEAMNRRGIQVSHAPGVTAEPVAESALSLILAPSSHLLGRMAQLRDGPWVQHRVPMIGRSTPRAPLRIVGPRPTGRA